ncbi:MAG: DUF4837 family protein [Bacteroidota bacterium]
MRPRYNKLYFLPRHLLGLIFFAFFFTSCSTNNNPVLPAITGKAGEIIVVIEKKNWDSNVGKQIKACLAQQHIALPQPEPVFTLVNIPNKSFTGLLKSHRNILIINISRNEKPSVIVKKDVWSTPQLVVKITASNKDELVDLINKNKGSLVNYYINIEKKRLMSKYAKIEEKSITKKLIKDHQLSLTVPKTYEIAKEHEKFIWIRRETNETSHGILIYYYDYVDSNTFTRAYILSARDSITKRYIPGPTTGSYMSTMRDYPAAIKKMDFKGMYAIETRGLWNVHGDFMGGPFLNYTILDEQRNRVVTVEGYVYAPKFDKRNYLRQVEAILCSLKIHS